MNEELNTYRQRAAAWLAEHAPRFSGSARRGLSFEQDLALGREWQALKAKHGYAGINLPTAYGGAGGDEMQKVMFCEEELRYELPLIYYSISLSNPVPIMLRYATEEARKTLGPAAIRGEHIWCQLFSEPAAGSDLAALRLKAVPTEGGWLLSGQKVWTSWAQIADWGVVVTRTDPTVPKHAGLTYFYLNMKSPGITVRPIRRLGEEHDLNEVFFDDVFVPDNQRLGKVGEGFKVAVETLMIERYAVVDESGYAQTLEQFVDFARKTRVRGKSGLADGEIRAAIASSFVERQGLRSIHRRAITAMVAGAEPGPEGAIRKLLMGRTRQRLGALALDLMGADGVRLDPDGNSVTQFAYSWIDPCTRIAGGTDEILMNTLAERILGLPQDFRPDKGQPFNQSK